MDSDDDHYRILGLPSGYEGTKLTLKDIEKAYRSKARSLHPDKNPNDPLAKSKFQNLQASFQILKDDAARKAFDDLLRAKLQRLRRDSNLDSKRRRMVSDLEARERASEFTASDPAVKSREEEERARKKFQEEIAKIRREMSAKKEDLDTEKISEEKKKGRGEGLDKERILKVSWEKGGEGYSAERLRDLFGRFGEVEDVVIRSGAKKRRSALVVMGSKEAAVRGGQILSSYDLGNTEVVRLLVAATRSMCGDMSNPLLVLPLNPIATNMSSATHAIHTKPELPTPSDLVGAAYQANEVSILEKLKKASQKQKEVAEASKVAVEGQA